MEKRRKGLILVLSFIVLILLTSTTLALANEIWVTPSGLKLPSSGNWPAFVSPWATFSFAVPDNMTAFQSAKLVVIGEVSRTVTYSMGLSIAGNGEPQNYYTDSAPGLKATLTKHQLQEIDISSYIPTGKEPDGFKIMPGDYIGLNFQFSPANAANVLGVRFQYEGPMGPQGPKGDKGDKGDTGATGESGAAGHSPVLTWSGDRIAIDGAITGPHLTGPQGPQGVKGDTGATGESGASVYPIVYTVTQSFSCPSGKYCPTSFTSLMYDGFYWDIVYCDSYDQIFDSVLEVSTNKISGFGLISSIILAEPFYSRGNYGGLVAYRVENYELWAVVGSITIKCLGLRPK